MRPVDKGKEPEEKYQKYQDAEILLEDDADKELFLNQTMRLAKATGFFSVWMEVFKDYKEVQKKLIAEFQGTQTVYFKDILC